MCKELGDQESQAVSLDALGLVMEFSGKHEQAREFFEQALELHRTIDNKRGQGYALTHLGYALTRLGFPATAFAPLREALTLRREAGAGGLVLDTIGGLAFAYFAQGEPELAHPHVVQILSGMKAKGAAGIEFPVQLYLICYQVLEALSRHQPQFLPAAHAALEDGHRYLMDRAERIKDARIRHQFLQSIPFNRELRGLWLRTRELQS
jgi:tetratricopeptide (TPR) repeat protein